jgi:hypothetical protein
MVQMSFLALWDITLRQVRFPALPARLVITVLSLIKLSSMPALQEPSASLLYKHAPIAKLASLVHRLRYQLQSLARWVSTRVDHKTLACHAQQASHAPQLHHSRQHRAPAAGTAPTVTRAAKFAQQEATATLQAPSQ